MIVGNIANHELGLGFESDYNKVTIFSHNGTKEIDEDKKTNIALNIVDFIAEEYSRKIKIVKSDAK